ncbi:permease transporter [Salpingoeca rosetta]|uniref:Permease transporter n=1 Tax=Salpingoeca rosetta (strain ATCC 50818 / BSB-021) TaxID=946362 RepID=F2UEI7_SALR5|nr:permease transporter [Salpingoeca rosetta]EGD75037.1 permease transporter [Salpingoeca rosetta]|eukprot:XP_004992681.1 permease transporter [Salpingoeca rosetta]
MSAGSGDGDAHSMHEFLIQEGDNGDVLGLTDDGLSGESSTDGLGSSSSGLMDGIEVDTSLWRVSRLSLILLNVGWTGLACVLVAWGVVMLPSQVRSTVGNDRVGLGLAAIVVVGSLLIVTPLIGMLSDRSTLSYGRRRPWMLIGLVWLVIAQICLGLANPHKPAAKPLGCEDELNNATSIVGTTTAAPDTEELHGHLWALILVYGLATVGYQLIGTPYTGLIADHTPPAQRGFGSGMNGILTVTGNLLGASVGFLFASSLTILHIYIILSILVTASVLVVVFSQPEDPPPKSQQWRKSGTAKRSGCSNFVLTYVEPLKHHDFRWVFFTRFLMQQGLATVLFFLELYFHDQVDLPGDLRSEEAVAYALVPLFICAGVSSVLSGMASDRSGGKRKRFVIGAALIMSVSTIVLVFVRSFYACLAVAGVFGAGYGCFTSVDFALVLDVLPNERDRAKDLAIWHQALVLPQLIATPIGGAIRDGITRVACSGPSTSPNHCKKAHCPAAYIVLFSITAAYFLLSALFVRRVRGVK